jgi:hypothetical protein
MRITKEGRKPNPVQPFWLGLSMECRSCDCHFTLEIEDGPEIQVHQEKTPNGKKRVACDCPHCGGVVIWNSK